MKKTIITAILALFFLFAILNVASAADASTYRGMAVTVGFKTPYLGNINDGNWKETTPVNSPKSGGPPYFINYVESDKTKAEKVIAFTYDMDGYEPGPDKEFNKELVDYLIQNKIKATFFISQRWVERNPSSFKLLLQHQDIFEIGSHSKTHSLAEPGNKYRKGSVMFWGGKDGYTDEDMIPEWKDSVTYLRSKGVNVKTCRLPVAQPWSLEEAGTIDLLKKTVEYCSEFIQYDIWELESDSMSPAKFKDSIVNKLTPGRGSIVLGHAGHEEWVNQKEGMELVMAELKSRGYKLLTVSELLDGYAGPGGAVAQPKQLTLREKIAQMMMTTPGVDGKFVSEFNVGGVILMRDDEGTGTVTHAQGDGGDASAAEIKKRVSTYQSKANIPLLVSSDVEGGSVNRIKSLSDPGDARSIGDASKITQAMTKTGQVMKDLGINMDLAPVVDVAPNTAGVVMEKRAFSDDPKVVKEKGAAYIQGLHASGVAATLKHFPGYGGETRNSDATFVDVAGIIPEQKGVFDGLKPATDAIMMSNIIYKKEDPKNQAVVSPAIVGLARQSFNGVIISDDLGAKSLLDTQYKGDVKKMAVDVVKSGVDILLIVNFKKSNSETEKNIKLMIDAIEEAVKSGDITEARIDESVARILALKQKYAGYTPGGGAAAAAPAKDCVPGTFYGGSSVNVDLNSEGIVDIPLMDGEKICFGTAEQCRMKASAVQMLYPLYKLFKENGCQLHISNAYRTLEQYRYNWVVKVKQQGRPASNYCGPQPRSDPNNLDSYKHCPHYNGYAIDIASASCPDATKRIKLACEAGWVNYAREGWHFEYGSNQWNKVKKIDPRLCQFGSGASIRIDKDPITNPQSSGAPATVPTESLSYKEVNQFGGLKIIEADLKYFDIKTISAKTIIENIGSDSCTVCKGDIVDLKSKYTGFNAVAGINAGFIDNADVTSFSGKLSPEDAAAYKKYGYPVEDYVEAGKVIKGKPDNDLSLYFVIENGVPKIIKKSDFSASASIGSAVAGTSSATGEVARTMACIEADGKIKLVTAKSAKVKELKDYLTASENCKDIINFDGGGSPQMIYNWNGADKPDKGTGRPVSNFLVVVPKTAQYGAASYSSSSSAPQICPPGSIHNSGEDEVLYAAYLISGAFSTVINYTLAPYTDVQSTIKDLVTLKGDSYCGESTSIDCLANKTANNENFNFSFKQGNLMEGNADWNKFCESPAEQFFSEFGEIFDACIEYGGACSCTMDSSASKLGDKKIQINKVSDTKYVATLTGSDKTFTLFTGEYAAENIPSEITSGSGTISINKAGGKVSFSGSASSQCLLDIQTVKVCAVSNKVSVVGISPITGNFSNNSLTFRFAFIPPNTPPPDVKKVTAADLKYASNMVILSWYKSAAKNVLGYNIYQDIAVFAGQKSADVKLKLTPLFLSTSNEKFVNSLSTTPECLPKGNKLCTFVLNALLEGGVVEKIALAPGTLIFENNTNKYYYLLGLADKDPKYFGITAVNKKHLESANFIETPKAESVDDIPPGPVTITHSPDAIDTSLVWARPQFNLDGSQLLPFVPVYYDVVEICTSGTALRIGRSTDATTINNYALDANCQIKGIIAKKQITNLYASPNVYSPFVNYADLKASLDYPIINYLLQ